VLSDCLKSKIRLLFSTSYTEQTSFKLKDFRTIFNHPSFNKNWPTVLYAHGFTEHFNRVSVQTVKNAYMQRGGFNYIVIDWSAFSGGIYFLTTIPKLYEVGLSTGKYLMQFLDAGYPISRVHLIGHSLGGELSGLIGRTLRFESRGRYVLPRITALDPAGPDFDPPYLGSFTAISINDA